MSSGLDLMTAKNESRMQTPFTVTIEAREGVTTGVSAHDRAHTIQVAIDPRSRPADLVQPGHVNPLKAKPGGVLERTGHTEASVDLARLAGLIPAGVICEVMNDDGSMARVPDLIAYCAEHRLKMVTIKDLIAYRRRSDRLVERVVSTRLPTAFGTFEAVGYRSLVDDKHHLALVKGEIAGQARRARAGPFGVPDGRRLPLRALRLRRPADRGAGDDRGGGRGRAALPRAGGPRDRAAQQAARLQAAGGGPRHRRGQRAPRAARRPARLRHRRADPRRSRAHLDPDPHQQPEEDPRARGLRTLGHRPDPDRAAAQPREPRLPARQAREARPHAPPPGPRPRRRDAAPRARPGPPPASVLARYAIVVARFYDELAARLERGARACSRREQARSRCSTSPAPSSSRPRRCTWRRAGASAASRALAR